MSVLKRYVKQSRPRSKELTKNIKAYPQIEDVVYILCTKNIWCIPNGLNHLNKQYILRCVKPHEPKRRGAMTKRTNGHILYLHNNFPDHHQLLKQRRIRCLFFISYKNKACQIPKPLLNITIECLILYQNYFRTSICVDIKVWALHNLIPTHMVSSFMIKFSFNSQSVTTK